MIWLVLAWVGCALFFVGWLLSNRKRRQVEVALTDLAAARKHARLLLESAQADLRQSRLDFAAALDDQAKERAESERLTRRLNELNDALTEASDKLKTAGSVRREDLIEALLKGSACPFSPVCNILSSLEHHNTFRDAAAGLERLAGVLSRHAFTPESCRAALEKLSRIITNVSALSLSPPGSPQDVYVKAFECLAGLGKSLATSPENFNAAVVEIKTILRNPDLRGEAIRNLLVELLSWQPGNPELLAMYREQLECTQEALERGDHSPFGIALNNIAALSAVDANRIADFLQRAFPSSGDAWRVFGDNYKIQLHRVFSDRAESDRSLQPLHLTALLHKAQGYIAAHEPSLFEVPRHAEYMKVNLVIHAIHGQQGTKRSLRPPNRHVVTDVPGISATITLTDAEHRVARGRVENLGVGDERFKGGAWIVSNDGHNWPPPSSNDWSAAQLTLVHDDLGGSLEINATVNGPYPQAGQYGFRVTWGITSLELATALEPLLHQYPLTR
jgi:hypothetical protein